MLRKSSIIAFGVVLIACVAFIAWQVPTKMKYDAVRDQLETPLFSAYPMDDESVNFLKSVRKSWEVQTQESPDSTFAEISSLTGVEETVDGVVTLYTHEIPEYSFINRGRNAKETVMAATISVALPISVDNRIYVDEGLAFIRLNERVVEVYEDTEAGLMRTLYVEPTPANKLREDRSDDA